MMHIYRTLIMLLCLTIGGAQAQVTVIPPAGSGGGGTVTATSADNLSNKTINANSNTIVNIGSSEIIAEIISGFSEEISPGSGMFLLLESGGALKKVDVDNLPGSGQSNTASNVGVAGVGVFKQKVGANLEYKKLNAGSSKITVTDDVANNEIDIDVATASIQIGNLAGAPTGAVVGDSDSQTLTNKTINANNNTLVNIGAAQIVPDIVSGLTEEVSPQSGDFLLGTSGGVLRRFDVGNISGTGQSNTASNVGIGGVGPFKQKTGIDLEFKNMNAGSSKITITNDVANNEIDIDVVPAQIAIGALSGAPTGTVVGTSDTQTLTGKTIDADGTGNVITNIGSSEIKAELVTGLTEDATPASGDFILGTSAGLLRRFNVGNLPDAGEENTCSNIGVAGVGIFKQKSGIDFEFKKLNAGSSKITVTDDVANNEIDIDVAPAQIDITALQNAPTGAVVGTSDAQTLTNKVIDAANNTLTNIGNSQVNSTIITGHAEQTTPASGMEFLIVDAGTLKRVDFDNMPGAAGGEINTASNIGAAGVGVFDGKVSLDLQFKKINVGSAKVTVTDDVANNEIDIDVVPAQIAIGDLSGAPTGAVVGTSDAQTLTNKTIDAANNTITNIGSAEVTGTLVTGQLEDTDPVAGEFLLGESGGNLRKFDIDNLGGIADILGCSGPSCNNLVTADGAALDFSAVDMSGDAEGITLGIDPISGCDNVTKDGLMCWDGSLDKLYVANGTGKVLIGPDATASTLHDVVANGRVVTSLVDLASAIEFNNEDGVLEGEDVSGFRFYVGPSGPRIDCFVGEGGCDQSVNVDAGKAFILNLDGEESLRIDASTGDVTLAGKLLEKKQIEIPSGMFAVDGTHCIREVDTTINTEVEPVTVTCADNDAATIKLRFKAPNSWDEASLEMDLYGVNIDPTPDGSINMDWTSYCVGASDLYGTAAYAAETSGGAMDFSVAGAQFALIKASTSGQVPLGTCSEGDIVLVRGQVDSVGTTSTDTGSFHILNAVINITMNDWSN